MKKKLEFAAVFAGMLLIAGCGKGTTTNRLVGTYAIKEHGKLVNFIRLQKKGDAFYITEKQSGKWGPSERVSRVKKKQLSAIANKQVSVPFVGLSNKNEGIFKMPKGWRLGTFQTKTGYWLGTPFGPIELYKR